MRNLKCENVNTRRDFRTFGCQEIKVQRHLADGSQLKFEFKLYCWFAFVFLTPPSEPLFQGHWRVAAQLLHPTISEAAPKL